MRDHSWGPRFWQAPWYYRWLTGNFGDDGGLRASRSSPVATGRSSIGGVVLEDGEYRHVEQCDIDTDWRTDDCYHERIRADRAHRERDYEIEGTVMSLIPLRNRRTTPEGEQLVDADLRGHDRVEVHRPNGEKVGYGLSEYLDQIVDGKPVGAAA